MDDHLSWTSRLIRAFYSEGVRHVYISPGSRSTPLVYGVAAHSGLHKHIILDERSAAFQALGNGKATGIPALLICTSGTAAANYYPAVIEARQSGVPFIVLSADRPPHLRGTGSSQTIDQIKLFGDYPLLYHELGEPVHRSDDYLRLDLLARRAVTTAVDTGGPVHINAPFRKPLVPAPEVLQREKKRNREQTEKIAGNTMQQEGAIPPGPRQGADQSDMRQADHTSKSGSELHRNRISTASLPSDIFQLMNRSERPLCIAGPEERYRSFEPVIRSLTDDLNIPVIAEPGSHITPGAKTINRFDFLLRSDISEKSLKPDLVIRTGDTPTSKILADFSARHNDVPVIQFLNRETWQDSTATVTHRVLLRNRKIDVTGIRPKQEKWAEEWIRADRQAGSLLGKRLEETDLFTDGHVIHHFTGVLQNDWNLMTSNSFTVRDLALFGSPVSTAARTYVSRGAAGIDGILSTTIGISHGTGRGSKTAVFIGDLAFLHDSNALMGLLKLDSSLLIIIINNRGGNIFRMLPVYDHSSTYTDYFETPQSVDITHLAMAHQIPCLQITTVKGLAELTGEKLNTGGPLIIECHTEPDPSMELRQSLWSAGKELL